MRMYVHGLSLCQSYKAPAVHLQCFVTGQIVPNLLKYHSASIFRVKQISFLGLLVPEDVGTIML